MDVQFYIPKYEIVPTKLRLMVDGKYVTYERFEYEPVCIAYDFYFMDATDEEAVAIATKIADNMESQSYGHGSEWRKAYIEIVEQNERYRIGQIVRVAFKVRDAG